MRKVIKTIVLYISNLSTSYKALPSRKCSIKTLLTAKLLVFTYDFNLWISDHSNKPMAAIQEELSLAFDNQAYLSLNLDSGFDSSPSSYENVPVQSSLVNGKKHTLLIIDIPLA